MPPATLPEAEILDRGIALLRDVLPTTWQVQPVPDQTGDSLVDAILNIGGPQNPTRVVVEVKKAFAPKDVGEVVRRARLLNRVADNVPLLVMAPWLSERSRALLTDGGINYLDLAGDVRIVSDYPPLFIYRQSTEPAPKSRQSTPSLRGIKAGRVAGLLTDVSPPYGVLEIAKHTGVTPGYVSRLLETLESEDLVRRERRGAVVHADWRELIKRRAETYGVFTSNQVLRFVCPNGPAYALEVAGDPPIRNYKFALTGSLAAERIVSVAPPDLLILYAEFKPVALVEAAGLLPAEAGANVIIAIPSDPVVMDPRWPDKPAVPARVPIVAASQLALDCLTGVGRMPQEGEVLLEWMAEDESRWRLPSLAQLTTPLAPL